MPEISKKIIIVLKYKFSGVIEELFGYNLHESAKKMIAFFITPGILEKKNPGIFFWTPNGNSILVYVFPENALYTCVGISTL